MIFRPALFLLLLVIVLVASPSTSARICVVIPNTPVGFQLKAAAQVASQQILSEFQVPASIIDTTIEIDTVVLTGSPQTDLDRVITASTMPNISLAIVASAQEIFTATFTNQNIPVALVGPEVGGLRPLSGVGSINLYPARDLLDKSTIDLLTYFGWNSSNIVYTPPFAADALRLESLYLQSRLTVSARIQLDATSSAALSNVIINLEKSLSKVIVFIGSADDLAALVSRSSSSIFEIVWLEPGTLSSTRLTLNTTRIYSRISDVTPLGIFSLGILQNSTKQSSVASLFTSANASAFSGGISDYAYHSYDAVVVWAAAVKAVGNFSDTTGVSLTMRSSSPVDSSLVSPYLKFHSTTGQRLGPVGIFNLATSRQAAASSAVWSTLGFWESARNETQPNRISITGGPAQFADGTRTIPSSQQRPSIPLGLVWWDTTNPTWNFLYSAWRNVTQWAIDDVNSRPDILQGSQLRLLLGNNEDSASQTILAGVELADRGVVGYLGPARSQHSIALQYYAGGLQIPHISFASTSDSLSDKRNYPTFFRTIIPDRLQGKALAAMLQYYNWTSCCLLNYDDNYSNGVANNFVAAGNQFGLKVLARSIFLTTRTDFNETFTQIKNSGCKIVVAIIDFSLLPSITAGARRANLFGPTSGNQWIFPEAAAADMNRRRLIELGLNSSDFNGVLVTNPLAGRDESPLYRNFVNFVKARTRSEPILYQSFLWDAVQVYAQALGLLIREGLDPRAVTSRPRLLTLIKSTILPGVSGPVSFDDNQDRVGVAYGIYNYREDAGALALIGLWSDPSGINLTRNAIFSDGTETIPTDLEIGFISFSSGGGAAITTVVTIAIALISVVTSVAVFFETHRRNRLIIRSSPRFLLIIVLGLTLALISIYFWFGTPSPALCHLRIWFAFIGCAIAYSALLTKNWHLWYLFNEPSLRVVTVSTKKLVSILLLVVAPLALVLILWSSIDPFRIVLQENPSKSIRYLTCRSSNDVIFAAISFAYMGFVFCLGAFLSFKTRTLPDSFRESKWIALSTYNLIFVSAVGILVGYVLSFEPTAYPFIVCVCILFCAFVTWALIFVPKFWIMWLHPERITDKLTSTTSTSRTQMASATDKSFTQEKPSRPISSTLSAPVSQKAKRAAEESSDSDS